MDERKEEERRDLEDSFMEINSRNWESKIIFYFQ